MSTLVISPPRAASRNKVITGILAALVAAPLSVVLHELGHYLVFLLLGFDDAALHYGSVSLAQGSVFWEHVYAGAYASAEAIYPTGRVAAAVGGGLAVTTVLSVLSCAVIAATQPRPHPFFVALGLLAPLRFLVSVAFFGVLLAGFEVAPMFDEYLLALALQWPEVVPPLASVIVLIGTWWFIIAHLEKPRWQTLGAISLGALAGLALWIMVLGPLLLP